MMLGTYGTNSRSRQTAAEARAQRIADKQAKLAQRLAALGGAK